MPRWRVMRERASDLAEDGEPADAGIEYADRPVVHVKREYIGAPSRSLPALHHRGPAPAPHTFGTQATELIIGRFGSLSPASSTSFVNSVDRAPVRETRKSEIQLGRKTPTLTRAAQ